MTIPIDPVILLPMVVTPRALQIRGNLRRVQDRIQALEAAAGRPVGSTTLVAVTKAAPPDEAAMVLRAGVRHLGENRPEALLERAELPDLEGAVWHLIGTYQRRKIRDTLRPIQWIHSIDSVDLARAVSKRAVELSLTIRCLVQVNLSGEATKQWFPREGLDAHMRSIGALPNLAVRGLMTMAPLGATELEARTLFAKTRELRDALATSEHPLPELSMGMSGDYEAAVLEGATLVRIGSALFSES